MADKLMYIPNDDKQNHPSEDYNYWLKRFDAQVNESTNQNTIKSPKLFSQRIEKESVIKNYGDYCNKQPIVPFLLEYFMYLSLFLNKN